VGLVNLFIPKYSGLFCGNSQEETRGAITGRGHILAQPGLKVYSRTWGLSSCCTYTWWL